MSLKKKNNEEFTRSSLPEHLQPVVDNVSPSLSELETQKLSALIGEFQDVFLSPDWELGQTSLAEHFIDTGDTKPFNMLCRRLPMFKRPINKEEI